MRTQSGHRPLFRRHVTILVLFAALVAAGCGNAGSSGSSGGGKSSTTAGATSTAPGVTADAINFAALSTGAANPLGTCYLVCYTAGINAYFAYRNSEGGLFGKQLKLSKVVDDELGKNQAKALEILSANDTIGIFSSPLLTDGFAAIQKAKVPLWTTVVQGPVIAGSESSFAPEGATCLTCTQKFDAYMAKVAGAKKVGVMGYGVQQASKDCVTGAGDSIKKYGPAVGASLAYQNDALEFGLPNGIGPEVTAMKKAGVGLVITCIDQNAAKTLAREVKRQDAGMKLLLPSDGYGTAGFLESTNGLLDGDYMSNIQLPFEANTAGTGLEQYLKWMDKSGHKANEGLNALYGWLDAAVAYQGIKAAGPAFDRASIVAATNKIQNDTMDGIVPPTDWGRQHVPPTEADPVTHGPQPYCMTLFKISGTQFQIVGGTKAKPFLCWDPKDEGYSAPTLTSFK